jgi:hypothetical protein
MAAEMRSTSEWRGISNHHPDGNATPVVVELKWEQIVKLSYLVGEEMRRLSENGWGENGGLTKSQANKRRELRRIREVLNEARLAALEDRAP